MSTGMDNIELARNNEDFADDVLSDYNNQNNWVITIRFYSFLHYVEERLNSHGYSSNSHKDRKNNIRNCRPIDDKVRKIYRFLEDISRDARYECIHMTKEDVEKSGEKLEEGKNILGFHSGDSNTTTKYST